MKNIIIASTSTVHGSGFLDYLMDDLKRHYKACDSLLFIPYARPGGASYESYTESVIKAFQKIDKKVTGIHEFEDPKQAIENADGIFVGGGNTFVLVNQLYKNDLIPTIQNAVKNGTPYLGTSAGSNICGLNICTTNDMPIVYPSSFKTLALIPFNINPHYLDPDPLSKHMGETRETRIKEFHSFNSQPVVGLREGSFLEVTGDKIILKGALTARIFEQDKDPYEIESNKDLSYLN